MFKNLFILAAFAIIISSCNSNKVEVKDGLKYQFHNNDNSGKTAKLGDIISLHLVLKNSTDSVIRNSYKDGAPIVAQVQKAMFKGGFEDGLLMLSKGDSATFFVPVDSTFKGYPSIPPMFKKGTDMKFTVKVMDVQSEADFKKNLEVDRSKRKETDAKTIAGIATTNNFKDVKVTASGLNYVITSPGTGPQIVKGDSVTLNYNGKLANGKSFEKNTFSVVVGIGSVIPGWDEGLQNFKQGDKGTLLIPSGLAYGEQGSPPVIPANAILVFDIEILKVKKNK